MSSTHPQTSIRLLGPIDVRVDGRPVAFDTRKAIAMLAYLAVVRRPASRETLAALLWPDSGGTDARNAFRRTLSVLRAGLDGRGIVADRSAVALDETAVDVDLWRFRAALGRARGHSHPLDSPCMACFAALDEALAEDRGPFMEGFSLRDSEDFDDWQAIEAESHRRDLAGALERVARARAAERRWDLAIEAARRWLTVDPLHEPAHQLMITALARSGETAAAIAQYRDLVRLLDRELGVAPLSETTELVEAVRDGRILGWGPTEPEGGRASAAGPTSAVAGSSAAARLPLVGRDGELSQLVQATTSTGRAGRVLVIEGEAGVGKTRLAEAVATAVLANGGTVLEARALAGEAGIPFAVVGELVRAGMSGTDAAERVAALPQRVRIDAGRVLSLPGETVAASEGSQAGPDPFGRLRTVEALGLVLAAIAEGPAGGLIWVDDIDRADSSSAEVIAYLARRLADRRLAILLTGRFDPADAQHLPGVVTAVVRAADPHVTLSRLDRSAVAALAQEALGEGATPEIVESLMARSEGLPLYLAEALASPDPGGPDVPGGMLELIRARIAALDEIGRQVLAAAAVIGRSFDLTTVQAAAGRGDEETVEGIEALLRRGIIREIPPDEGDDVRYDFTHGRLRDVAYDDTSLARRRLLHGRVADALTRPGSALPGSTRWALIASHAAAAGRTEVAAAAHVQAGRLARAMFANPEAREHFEAALALGHPEVAAIHDELGDISTLLGDYAAALRHYEAAAAAGEPDRESSIERRIGLVHVRRGDLARADRHLDRASQGAVDEREAGRILVDRAAVAIGRGDFPEADRFADLALATATRHGDALETARARAMLGVSARRAGDPVAARMQLEGALAAADEADDQSLPLGPADPSVRIAALNTLGLVALDAGEPVAAEALFRDALERCERQGDRHRQAALENSVADALHAQGRTEESMEHLRRAVALFAEVGGQPGVLEPEIWKLVEW